MKTVYKYETLYIFISGMGSLAFNANLVKAEQILFQKQIKDTIQMNIHIYVCVCVCGSLWRIYTKKGIL